MPANNSLNTRFWALMQAQPGVPVKPGGVKVTCISFEGYTLATHRCMVKDGGGNIIFETAGKTDLTPVDKHFDGTWIDDLILEDLDSGRVVVTTL